MNKLKNNPTEWSVPFKYRDKEYFILYNSHNELSDIKKKMNKIIPSIYVYYIVYNHNTGKYNLTKRELLNYDNLTLKKFLRYSKNNFIELLNKEYKRRYLLTGKKLETLEIIGFHIPLTDD